jgi:hypothetical protein
MADSLAIADCVTAYEGKSSFEKPNVGEPSLLTSNMMKAMNITSSLSGRDIMGAELFKGLCW